MIIRRIAHASVASAARAHASVFPVQQQRRAFVSSSQVAIAFDIDGVLVRGKQLIPGAKQALHRITPTSQGGTGTHVLPYAFLTNGGGVLEHVKSTELSTMFDLAIPPEQICLSHSPMRELVARHAHEPVLVVGMSDVKNVALGYGFQHVLTPADLAERWPSLVPHITKAQRGREPKQLSSIVPPQVDVRELQAIRAVLVLHDPIDWYRDCQLILDVLTAGVGAPDAPPPPTVYFSNPDFLFSGHHWSPRLAQGAFRVALAALYKEWMGGQDLSYVLYGKPEPVTYRYAEKLILERARALQLPAPTRFFMIGDNPAADIRGGNQAGAHWSTILVRSGSIKPSTEPRDQPTRVVNDVAEAIEWILEEAKRSVSC